MIYTFIW